MKLQRSKTFAIVGLLALAGCASAGQNAPAASSRSRTASTAGATNVILLVADGAGIAYWSAAKLAREDLAVKQMPVAGLVDTRSSNSRVTDSGAAAAAYATGVRTFNGALSVDPACGELMQRDSLALKRDPGQCKPLETVFDVAGRRGMATGVVTTTAVIDATPAAFVAHTPQRYWYDIVADQYPEAGLTVMLGGGRRFFDGTGRQDNKDLLSGMCARATCLASAAELAGYRPDERPLIGLFAPGDMPPAGQRSPTLPDMVRVALARLSQDPQGFVAVLETEGTDNSGHANEPLASITAEMLEFDQAVAAALDFARRDGRTLVIVTGDHETGGLSLMLENGAPVAKYTTRGHTGEMVPLFAFGPGAERFGGVRDNDEIGRLLKQVVAERR